MKNLLFAWMLFAAGAAHADDTTTTCQTMPGGLTECSSHSDNWAADYSRMLEQRRQANIDAMSRSIQGVSNALAARKTVANAVLVINCGKATKLIRTFADGHIDQSDMGGVVVSDLDIATIQASLPSLHVVRGCDVE